METPFAALLRQFRKRYGIRQAQLTRHAKFGRNTIADWEAGKHLPLSFAEVEKIIPLLRLNPAEQNQLRRAYEMAHAPLVEPVAQQPLRTAGRNLIEDLFEYRHKNDPSEWSFHGPRPTWIERVLVLGSNAVDYPFIHPTKNIFSEHGAFDFDVEFRCTKATERGAGIALTATTPIPGGSLLADRMVFGIWQDISGLRLTLRGYGLVFDSGEPDYSEHHVRFRYDGSGSYYVFLDGEHKHTSQEKRNLRPTNFWLGNPTRLGSKDEWVDLAITSIRISTELPTSE